MLNITKMAEELKELTAWQEIPEVLWDDQYQDMIIRGIKRLFIDTGRAILYNAASYQRFMEDDTEYFGYDGTFEIDEERYIMICAQMEFFKRVQSDVNNIIGYSTNALTVTNADKPYENLKDSLLNLENERRILFFKMVRFTLRQ